MEPKKGPTDTSHLLTGQSDGTGVNSDWQLPRKLGEGSGVGLSPSPSDAVAGETASDLSQITGNRAGAGELLGVKR